MSQEGVLSFDSSKRFIEFLTGNSGGPIGPDLSGNIDILGNNTTGINIVGNAGTNTLTVLGLPSSTTQIGTTAFATAVETGTLTNSTKAITPAGVAPILVTPYVVAAGGAYTTIQSALDAANAAGGGMVWVRPGTYTENLTFYSGIQISGPSEQDVTIIGIHTPPSSGTLNINRMTLESATHIFSSNAVGTTTIIMEDCTVNVTNGYTFNLPNWTGQIQCFNIGNFGTNDGFINNTGGSSVFIFSSGAGNGTVNPMIISGLALFGSGLQISCPIHFVTGASLTSLDCSYTESITFLNNSTGSFYGDSFITGSNVSLTQSSSGAISLSNVSISTSNNPAIAGAGAGTLTLTNVSFLNNSSLAGTLTVVNGGLTDLGSIRSNFTAHSLLLGQGTRGTLTALGAATDGQLPIGSTGLDPVLATLTPGAGIAIANAAGSITISATGAGFAWSDTSGAFGAVKENGYFITATSTATLPAAPAEGDTIAFIVDTTQILTITANAGQQIRVGSAISGVAGTCASNARGDSIELVYRNTGTTWFSMGAPQGTWTVT